MFRTNEKLRTILDAKGATGWGTAILVNDYRHLGLEVATDNSANLTIKIAGSMSDTVPTFSSAASTTNAWDYIYSIDLNNDTGIVGDTGLAITADEVRLLSLNVDHLRWINVQVSARSAGDVTVKVKPDTNA